MKIGLIFAAILVGLIPASIAKSKGYSFLGWWIYGFLFFIIALPHSILKKPLQYHIDKDKEKFEKGEKNIYCPNCGKLIPSNTSICVYCGNEF